MNLFPDESDQHTYLISKALSTFFPSLMLLAESQRPGIHAPTCPKVCLLLGPVPTRYPLSPVQARTSVPAGTGTFFRDL